MSSIGTFPEALQAFATRDGAICALALDHRDALRNAYERVGVSDVSEETMLEFKQRVIDELGSAATPVLLDAGALGRWRSTRSGVFMPLEQQGHEARAGGRLTRLLDDFGPEQAEALGVQGCKLLVYYRDDHEDTAGEQFDLAARAAESCRARGLALVVEPKVYRLEGEDRDRYAAAFADHVIAAAAVFADSGADLLKLQFPGDEVTCRQLDAAAGAVPWTLLGGSGASGPTFAAQLRVAVEAGACGFVAGRPIWGGALALPPDEQSRWLAIEARPLFERLVEIVETHARRSR